MKGYTNNRLVAGTLSVLTLCSAMATAISAPQSDVNFTAVAAENTGEVIYSTGFENGEGVDMFTGRKGVEVIEAVTESPYEGEYCMQVSGRESGWNGPQFYVMDIMEPNTEYTISLAVKAEWYNTLKISRDYTDSEGVRHYDNLATGVSQGEWITFENVKFSYTDSMSSVYFYVEGSDTANICVDDLVITAAPDIPIQEDIASLSDVYSPYFKIGTAITTSNLASKPFMNLVQKHFADSLTAGNEMKPEALLDRDACIEAGETNPQVNLAQARPILNYCRDNNIPMRGHTLVWHSQTPDWFFKVGYADDGDWVSKDVMIERMENYIKNVFAALEEEYPDVDIYAYDVVNEAWLDNGSPRTGGGQSENANYSGWVKVFGDNSFIEYAFTFARKYAPADCKLYYNDFNEYMPDKTAAIVEMANDLKEKGLIDGIGCQSHLDVTFPGISAYEKAIKAFAETGLDVQITELDATTSDTSEAGLETQAQYYSDIMDVLVKYSDSISAVVFWGVTDDQSWRASKLPLIFDAEFQAKPAYYSIVDGLEVPVVTTTTTVEPVATTTTTTATEPPVEETTTTTGIIGADYISFTDAVVEITDSSITFEENGTFDFAVSMPDAFAEFKAGDKVAVSMFYTDTGNGRTINHVTSAEIINYDIVYGDADLNGVVELNDAVLVMCNIVDGENYPLTEDQVKAADVYQNGDGLSNMDALAIQKYLAQLISELPESYMVMVD